MSWKTPITLLVLVGVLLAAAFYGWNALVNPEEALPKHRSQLVEAPACSKLERFRIGEKVKSRDIVVNVYNAGGIAGLAGETLDALVDNGFQGGIADNAPISVAARNVTVLTKSKRDPLARLVALQFKGDVTFAAGPKMAPGIDVVVGDEFVQVDTAAHRALVLRRPITTCSSIKRAAS